jgi:4-hydroxyphenylpyruvate dioxygenase-like putative hemolysin
MQPLAGKSIWKEFIAKKGYGLHHIALEIDDMNTKVKEFEEEGFKIIQSGEREVVKWGYLDTEEELDVTFELLERIKPK